MDTMQWKMYLNQNPQLNHWYRHAQGRPSWVWAAAVTAAVLVVMVPLMLLTLTAVLVAAAVFAVLSLVVAGLRLVNRLLGGGAPTHVTSRGGADDGRRNVRVIERP